MNLTNQWAGVTPDVSRDALALYTSSDVVDLHIDSFIWTRLFGSDPRQRHSPGIMRALCFGQADLPRLRAAGVGGAVWVISTNPFRSSSGRLRVFERNVVHLAGILSSDSAEAAVVSNLAEYRAARARGAHAAFMGVQGANAFAADLDTVEAGVSRHIVLVTLAHLTSSAVAATSSPMRLFGRRRGLSARGSELIERLNAAKIFVDLAHLERSAFFAAAEASDPAVPLLVSHTGVAGVYRHWRNIDDEQLRVVAQRGGVVGVMFHGPYLSRTWGRGELSTIVEHLEHIVRVAGDDTPALGSDWDGSIFTPADMMTCLELPRLVQCMLDRRWTAERIRKVLGGNFLRALAALRG